jgi:hypothetical protein
MYSSARVVTKVQQGGHAKVTLQATAPGITGKHSKATVQLSGPASSKVVVSATGAPNKKRASEAGTSSSKDKRATSSTLQLRGPSPWAWNVFVCLDVIWAWNVSWTELCVLNSTCVFVCPELMNGICVCVEVNGLYVCDQLNSSLWCLTCWIVCACVFGNESNRMRWMGRPLFWPI